MTLSNSAGPPGPNPLSSVTLAELAPGTPGRATGLSLRADRVRPGDLFAALPGSQTHGGRFAAAAVAAGAVAVLTDRTGAELAGALPVPVIVVPDPRATMAEVAAQLAGRPAERLLLLGVTGTNGKTTVVFCVQAILTGLGLDVATVGTLGVRWRGQSLAVGSTTITTPEAPQLQAGLARLVEGGCQAVAMEVSSHALALRRVDGLRFAAAGFTNLADDHLDFHGDREHYFQAKARLFEPARCAHAVLHVDDPAGARLAESVGRRGGSVLTLGRGPADLRIVEEVAGDGLTHVTLVAADATYRFALGLPGAHNVTDAAVAVGLIRAAGLDPTAGLAGLAGLRVPGRLQRVDLPGPAPAVYVDFAHTPQAVASALAVLAGEPAPEGVPGERGGDFGPEGGPAERPGARRDRGGHFGPEGGPAEPPGAQRDRGDDPGHPRDRGKGKLIAVLGAGGERDPSKRGPMGAAATAADVVVVTDDNPRHEDPAAIRRAVLAGARAAADADSVRSVKVVDGGERRGAIRWALAYAGQRDTIAVLGKGHETSQEVAGEFHEFSDAVVIAQEWARLGAGQPKEAGRSTDQNSPAIAETRGTDGDPAVTGSPPHGETSRKPGPDPGS